MELTSRHVALIERILRGEYESLLQCVDSCSTVTNMYQVATELRNIAETLGVLTNEKVLKYVEDHQYHVQD